jgi:hypothetical protein
MPDDTGRMIRLRAVGDRAGFSLGNTYYEPDVNGIVELPFWAGTSLCAHGAYAAAGDVTTDDSGADEVAVDAQISALGDPQGE